MFTAAKSSSPRGSTQNLMPNFEVVEIASTITPPPPTSKAGGTTNVNCVKCNNELLAGARFCPECGTPQPKPAPITAPVPIPTCIKCNAVLPADNAKFCAECGERQPKPAPITAPVPIPTCIKCNAVLPADNAKFCAECGERQPKPAPITAPVPIPTCIKCNAVLPADNAKFCLECGKRQPHVVNPPPGINTNPLLYAKKPCLLCQELIPAMAQSCSICSAPQDEESFIKLRTKNCINLECGAHLLQSHQSCYGCKRLQQDQNINEPPPTCSIPPIFTKEEMEAKFRQDKLQHHLHQPQMIQNQMNQQKYPPLLAHQYQMGHQQYPPGLQGQQPYPLGYLSQQMDQQEYLPRQQQITQDSGEKNLQLPMTHIDHNPTVHQETLNGRRKKSNSNSPIINSPQNIQHDTTARDTESKKTVNDDSNVEESFVDVASDSDSGTSVPSPATGNDSNNKPSNKSTVQISTGNGATPTQKRKKETSNIIQPNLEYRSDMLNPKDDALTVQFNAVLPSKVWKWENKNSSGVSMRILKASSSSKGPQPSLKEEDLTDKQKATVDNLMKQWGFSKKLIYFAFERCARPDVEEAVIYWCNDNEEYFDFSDSEGTRSDIDSGSDVESWKYDDDVTHSMDEDYGVPDDIEWYKSIKERMLGSVEVTSFGSSEKVINETEQPKISFKSLKTLATQQETEASKVFQQLVQQQVQQLMSAINSLEAENEASTGRHLEQINKLTREKEELVREKRQLETNKDREMEALLLKKEREIKNLTINFENEKKVLKNEKASLEKRNATLEGEKRKLEEEKETLEKEKEIMKEEKTTLRDTLRDIREKNQDLQKRNQLLQDIQQELQGKNQQLQEENQILKNERQTESQIFQEEQQKLQNENQQLQNERQLLQKQILANEKSWKINHKDVKMTKQELGRGGWGVIWVGEFRGQKVAVKQMHESIVSAEYYLELLHREINTMSQLRHPNLVQFIGAVLDDPSGYPLIITEIMDMSLRKAYEKKQLTPVPVNIPLAVMRDVAVGLNYLHCLPDPIIHRDVSSANVLLESKDRGRWKTKISDFGSAKFARAAVTKAAGAAAYCAPEAFQSVSILDKNDSQLLTPKMDVFSYGILLCEVLTCRFPDEHEVFQAMLSQVRSQHPPYLHDLIQSCIKRNPQDRPNMDQVIQQLDSSHT